MTKIEINDRTLGHIVAFLPDLLNLCLHEMNNINNVNLVILRFANNLRALKFETLGQVENMHWDNISTMLQLSSKGLLS